MKIHHAIGLMSGSSLDGVDIAYCQFWYHKNKWHYSIPHAETVSYPAKWESILKNIIHNQNVINYLEIDAQLGAFFAECIKTFLEKHDLQNTIQFVSLHGHTTYHFPAQKISQQIGSGAVVAAELKIPVVCNLRHTDIALQGQGAPIVPIGDLHLFSSYNFCLNIGGIANISFKTNKLQNKIIAYDICPANTPLNFLAQKLGKPYDENGEIAEQAITINPFLYKQLNALPYYAQNYPKSLGNHFFYEEMLPMLTAHSRVGDEAILLKTITQHIVYQIFIQIKKILDSQAPYLKNIPKTLLATGGGAQNTYLIHNLKNILSPLNVNVCVPDVQTLNYKEALIMAFIGLLRLQRKTNVLKSVTGAEKNSISGAVYYF